MTKPVATTTALSERRLARSLGYPPSWHVVRTFIPHPTSPETKPPVIQDRIFAGDPAQNADLYYNHSAAHGRASDWIRDESGAWDDGGGQMLQRHALYNKGDRVAVLYDGTWYDAKITKVAHYSDEIRYSVLYTKDNAYQNNVTEDEMRPCAMKKAVGTEKSSKSRASSRPHSTANFMEDADPDELAAAAFIGLPEGWTLRVKIGNKRKNITIYSPDRSQRFTSKKKAYEYLGIGAPPVNKKARSDDYNATMTDGMDVIEEGDPPWRTEGHEYLKKRVRIEGQIAVIVGWISETDTDREGEPGFISEYTNEPASLFHVKFLTGELESQDFEEVELVDNFIEEEL